MTGEGFRSNNKRRGFVLPLHRSSLKFMTAQDNKHGDYAAGGTRQRVSACRRRLRQARVNRRALKLARDEAVLEAKELLRSVNSSADLSDPENVFEEAGASSLRTTRQFTSEVDRRARLRAR
jgi:hypothetical protein